MKKQTTLRFLLYTLCCLTLSCATTAIEAAPTGTSHSKEHLFPGNGDPAAGIDFEELEKALLGEGLVGEVHSAVPHLGLYVFTYRSKESFFRYVHMSLVTRSRSLRQKLSELKRHDRIKIWGAFSDNESPQKHIKLKDLEVVEKYASDPDIPKHDYVAELPRDLLDIDRAKFLVHANHADGQVIVLEYKDAVVPAFFEDNTLSRNLWRNDKIEMAFEIQDSPGRPVHIRLLTEAENPLRRYFSVRDLHWTLKKKRIEEETGKSVQDDDPRLLDTVEGYLTLFPESPQVRFDIWALHQSDADGLSTNYTIVNFEDPDFFAAIREKLRLAWETNPTSYVSGRNKLVNTKVKVRVTGKLNVVSPNQANPQVMPRSLDDIEIIILD